MVPGAASKPSSRLMERRDVAAVAILENQIFSSPWPEETYDRELDNDIAHYLVLELTSDTGSGAELIGYGGFWIVAEEAHITTLGVGESQQGRGYGRLLLSNLISEALSQGARWISLEVRASNERAIRLYRGLGFRVLGRRRGYYSDEGEDALVMRADVPGARPRRGAG